MKPLRVNADYEVELFHNRPAPDVINQTIEFFLFYLNDRILYSKKKYSEDYLKRVEEITHQRPVVTDKCPYENYWGPLKNLKLEKWWNSKLTSTELIISENWCGKTRILKSLEDLSDLSWKGTYLLKDPHAMSGQKFILLRADDPTEHKLSIVEKALINGPQILEPYFNRRYDFSQYVFPDGKIVAYENLVDTKFQYKGSVFTDHKASGIEDLSFYGEVSSHEWEKFKLQTNKIIQYYGQNPNEVGFSIDSFVYEEEGLLKIRVMSEVNYRRTMGRVAYELSNRFAAESSWTALVLVKPGAYQNHKNILVLSPGDSRFDILFLKANSSEEGEELLRLTELTVKRN